MDDTTQTMFPTDPAPPSDEFNTVAAAKSRAAVAMFTAIEGLATSRKDPEQLHLLAKGYRVMVNATDGEVRGRELQANQPANVHDALAPDIDELSATVQRLECLAGEHGIILKDVDTMLLDAFRLATKHSSVSVLERDSKRAQDAFPSNTDWIVVADHAQRVAAIRELAALAASTPKLRAELQAANDEVAVLREQIKAKPDITSILRVVVELVAFWRKGDEPYRHAAQVLEGGMMQVAKDAYVEEQNAARRVPAG